MRLPNTRNAKSICVALVMNAMAAPTQRSLIFTTTMGLWRTQAEIWMLLLWLPQCWMPSSSIRFRGPYEAEPPHCQPTTKYIQIYLHHYSMAETILNSKAAGVDWIHFGQGYISPHIMIGLAAVMRVGFCLTSCNLLFACSTLTQMSARAISCVVHTRARYGSIFNFQWPRAPGTMRLRINFWVMPWQKYVTSTPSVWVASDDVNVRYCAALTFRDSICYWSHGYSERTIR